MDYGHQEPAELLNGGADIRQYQVSTKEFIGNDVGDLVGLQVISVDAQLREIPGTERIIEADSEVIGSEGREGSHNWGFRTSCLKTI